MTIQEYIMKQNTRHSLGITSFLIVLTVVALYLSSGVFRTDYTNDQKLTYVISPEEEGIDYYAYLPVLELDGNLSPVISRLEVSYGNGSFELTEIEGRTVINLTARGNITLRSKVDLEFDSVVPSEEYFKFKWTTDPDNNTDSNPYSREVGIRGLSTSAGFMNLSVGISYRSESNMNTRYSGARDSRYEGIVVLDDAWHSIQGKDEGVIS